MYIYIYACASIDATTHDQQQRGFKRFTQTDSNGYNMSKMLHQNNMNINTRYVVVLPQYMMICDGVQRVRMYQQTLYESRLATNNRGNKTAGILRSVKKNRWIVPLYGSLGA